MKAQKIIKSGNSLALTLPSSLVKSLCLRPGDTVKVEIPLDQTHITYRFDSPRQLGLTPRLSLKV